MRSFFISSSCHAMRSNKYTLIDSGIQIHFSLVHHVHYNKTLQPFLLVTLGCMHSQYPTYFNGYLKSHISYKGSQIVWSQLLYCWCQSFFWSLLPTFALGQYHTTFISLYELFLFLNLGAFQSKQHELQSTIDGLLPLLWLAYNLVGL